MNKGIYVKMVNCAEALNYPNKYWKTTSKSWIMCDKEVIMLKGYSGAFDVDKLKEFHGIMIENVQEITVDNIGEL